MLTPPLQRTEVVTLLHNERARIAAHGVSSLFLFGSVARDEARGDSDVDLLVEFAQQPTFRGYMDLKFFLEDLLGHPVDLVTRSGLRPRVLPAVEREAIRVA